MNTCNATFYARIDLLRFTINFTQECFYEDLQYDIFYFYKKKRF